MVDAVAVLFLWVVLAVVAGGWAKRKGRSAALYFALSVVLSPLVGLVLVAIAAPNRAALATDGKLKRCPDCAEYVQPEARKCRYCGHEFRDLRLEIAKEVEGRILGAAPGRDVAGMLALATAILILGAMLLLLWLAGGK